MFYLSSESRVFVAHLITNSRINIGKQHFALLLLKHDTAKYIFQGECH